MYNLGVDLGGTKIKVGVVNETLEVIAKASVDTEVSKGSDRIIDNIAAACDMAIKNAGITMEEIESIGIGSPGAVDGDKGVVAFAGNLGLRDFPISELLGKKLGKSVFAGNDANAAALGEVLAGAAKGVKNSVCVTLGTGVGGGIIIDGRIYGGSNFCGGEIGHNVIVYDGLKCNCGRNGCWEKYASVTALISQTKTAMENDPDSEMWRLTGGSLDKVDGKTAFDAMRLGDKSGSEVVERYIGYVACGIVNVINTFQPDVICIGGAISKEKDTILVPLRRLIEQERFKTHTDTQTEVVMALLGNDAGIIGAANLYKFV